LGLVGLKLAGDDGEAIARRGLECALAREPGYRDAWALWTTLYRGDDERSGMVEILARHRGSPMVDLWRAELLVELRRYEAADALLDSLGRALPDDPAPRAWLARALFEEGRDAEAHRAYEAALRRAALDTGDVLWHQVRSIATPDERTAYARTGPWGREAFLRLFWARRDPDLTAPVNPRLGEHFRRLADAHLRFALLHPQSRWFHSRARRTVTGGLGIPPDIDLGAIRSDIAGTRQSRLGDEAVSAGLGDRLDPASEETANLEDGLDDRGRVLVRYGEPDERYVWSTDAETWRYTLSGGQHEVTFVRRTGDFGGDEVITPVVAGEVAAARHLLSTDRSDLAATLRFAFWPATFRSASGRATELVLFPADVRATGVLFDSRGREAARDSATDGALHLVAPPGRYLLALDAERAGRAGRFRGMMPLPRYAVDSLGVSSLLVSAGDVAPLRAALETAAPAALRLPAERPLRVYAEVYGLAAAGRAARYKAVYRFERAGGGFLGLGRGRHVTTVSFQREGAAADPAIETLVIDPGRLPRGHYRLTLEVHDTVGGARAASAALEFDLF
jgi:tetratricopeptide (TPR) repeat protein